MADKEKKTKKSCCARFRDWIGSPSFYIYTNFFLGAWGDRMWSFSVGLYLVALSKGLLRLAAIYGLCIGLSVLLFGGLLGDWVDRNPRMKVIRLSLFIQNFSVMLSAVAVCLTLHFEEIIDTYWDGGLKMICEASIVFIATIAQLASVAYKISLQKDWIVEVAGGKKSTLANLNAVMRALDLSCKVLAPTCTGVIMSTASLVVSATVIAGWNVVSVFIEYALLVKVYSMVPSLAVKRTASKTDEKEIPTEKEQLKKVEDEESQDKDEKPEPSEEMSLKEETSVKEGTSKDRKESESDEIQPKPKKKKKTTVEIIFDPFISVFRSWRIYVKQKVVFAGISLSFLYMTVLGFDSITVGFIYTNGVTELLAGICMGLAGVTGIIGTFIFTRLRPRIGLERTGLFAYVFEISFLSLSVVSVFAPGSPFDPYYKPGIACEENSLTLTATTHAPILDSYNITSSNDNLTHIIVKRNSDFLRNDNLIKEENNMQLEGFNNLFSFTFMGIGSPDTENIMPSSFSTFDRNVSQLMENNTPKLKSITNTKESAISELLRHKEAHVILKRDANQNSGTADENEIYTNQTSGNETGTDCMKKWKHEGLNISVILLLIGIITSRIGLWMADLTVTQILQESVQENERGAVGGVQSSLNMFFDLLKFIVVIFVPHIETFGYLIMMSYFFICCAGICFSFHSYRIRGHLFHCKEFWCYCCNKTAEKKPVANGQNGKTGVVVKDEKSEVEMEDIKGNLSQGENVV